MSEKVSELLLVVERLQNNYEKLTQFCNMRCAELEAERDKASRTALHLSRAEPALHLSRAERDLLLFFLEELSDKMSSAGCNDMDQGVIDSMDLVDRLALYHDYLGYNQKANPDGLEPTKLSQVPDLLWVAYLKSKIRGGK